MIYPESTPVDRADLPVDMAQVLHTAELMFDPDVEQTEPMCVVYGYNRTKCQFSLRDIFAQDDGKEKFGAQLAVLCCNQNVEGVGMFTEASMLATTEEPSSMQGGLREVFQRLLKEGHPAEIQDCLLLMYENRQWAYCGIAQVTRPAAGEPRALGEWIFLRIRQSELAKLPIAKAPGMQGCFAKASQLVQALAEESAVHELPQNMSPVPPPSPAV